MQTKTFLFAVLDWGLGHATRSAVVIDQLLQLNHKVIIASSGNALTYLSLRFPKVVCYELGNYELKYSANRKYWKLQLFAQSILLLRQYKHDQHILKELLSKHRIDAIISDNRPSINNQQIPSVYITHQLQLPSGFGSSFADFVHQKLYARYHQVWVPDVATLPNLAGDLSAKKNKNIAVHYLGLLSNYTFTNSPKKYQYTAILSGPEPQRSLLEEKLLLLFNQLKGEKLLIRGCTRPLNTSTNLPKEIKVVDLASNQALQLALTTSEIVICRSGYSSLMDLVASKTPALLVPTPGQPEQEYLATYVQQHNWFSVARQHELSVGLLQKATSRKLLAPSAEVFNQNRLISLLESLFST